MIREAIVKLVNKENLTYEMAEGAWMKSWEEKPIRPRSAHF